MIVDFPSLKVCAVNEFETAVSADDVEAVRLKYLGASGVLKNVVDNTKNVEDKRGYGQEAYQLKTIFEAAWRKAKERTAA